MKNLIPIILLCLFAGFSKAQEVETDLPAVGVTPFYSDGDDQLELSQELYEAVTRRLIQSKRFRVIDIPKRQNAKEELQTMKRRDFIQREIVEAGKSTPAEYLLVGFIRNTELFSIDSLHSEVRVDFEVKYIDVKTGEAIDAQTFTGTSWSKPEIGKDIGKKLLGGKKEDAPLRFFMQLKANLHNWSKLKGRENIEEKQLSTRFETILELSSKIIGQTVSQGEANNKHDLVGRSFLSVNYKNTTEPEHSDIYVHAYQNKKDSNRMLNDKGDLQEKLDNSLTLKIAREIKPETDGYPLSNLEVFQENGKISFRDSLLTDKPFEAKRFSEFDLIDENDCNILFIRISDFLKNGNHLDK